MVLIYTYVFILILKILNHLQHVIYLRVEA
jgi:hypothetical protein